MMITPNSSAKSQSTDTGSAYINKFASKCGRKRKHLALGVMCCHENPFTVPNSYMASWNSEDLSLKMKVSVLNLNATYRFMLTTLS